MCFSLHATNWYEFNLQWQPELDPQTNTEHYASVIKSDSYRGVARVDIHHLATKLLKAGTSWWYKRLWRIQPSHQRGFERCNNYTMAEMCVSTDMPEGTSLSLQRPVLLPIRPSFHTRVGSQKRRATVDWQKPWERSLRVTSIYILLHLLTRDRNWDRGGCRGIRRGILHKPMLYNPKLKFTVNAGLILQTFSKW